MTLTLVQDQPHADDEPALLAERITHHYDQAELAARDALTHAITCGHLLHDARMNIDHGAWGRWLDDNFPGSRRTASNFMRLAEAQQEIPGKLDQLTDRTITAALKAISPPKPTADRNSPDSTTVVRLDPSVEQHVLTIDQLGDLIASMGGQTTPDRIRRWIERLTEPKTGTCPDCQQPILKVVIKGETITASPYEWQPTTRCTKCIQTRNAHPGVYVHCAHCNNTGWTGTKDRPTGRLLAMDMAWSDTPNARIIGPTTDRREGEALHELHRCPNQQEQAA